MPALSGRPLPYGGIIHFRFKGTGRYRPSQLGAGFQIQDDAISSEFCGISRRFFEGLAVPKSKKSNAEIQKKSPKVRVMDLGNTLP